MWLPISNPLPKRSFILRVVIQTKGPYSSKKVDIDVQLLTLQCTSLPFGTRCRSFICGLHEGQQYLVRRLRITDDVVGEQEFSHPSMVKCLLRLDWVVLECLRLRICIGVKRWFINRTAARPETATTYFV